jgi:hypothetical protein
LTPLRDWTDKLVRRFLAHEQALTFEVRVNRLTPAICGTLFLREGANLFRRRYFILSPSFHGATLLAKLVNAHPNAACLGDTYPSNRYDQTCGCGNTVSNCEFWQTIKRRIGAGSGTNTPHLLPLTPKLFGDFADRILFRIFPITGLAHIVPKNANHAFISGINRFVETLHQLSTGRKPEVYVDGVKAIGRVRALLAAGGAIDGIIHLVRDPVDYAGSMTKSGKGSHVSFAKHAYMWRRQHRDIGRLSAHVPYFRIQYEDLCANPDETLARLFGFLDLSPMTLDELRCSDNEPWHFMGNKSLVKFEWTLERKGYDIGDFDRRLIEGIAG